MYYSIAVYPRKENEAGGGGWRGYVDCAAQEDFDEVFVSLHLPEYSIAEQMELLEQAAEEACQHGMRLTADNSAYGRYSGELEIALTDLPADVRVNVIGRIAEDDLWKLAYYRYGAEYRFQEVF